MSFLYNVYISWNTLLFTKLCDNFKVEYTKITHGRAIEFGHSSKNRN